MNEPFNKSYWFIPAGHHHTKSSTHSHNSIELLIMPINDWKTLSTKPFFQTDSRIFVPWWRLVLGAKDHRGWFENLGTFPSPREVCRGAALRGQWTRGCEQQKQRWRCSEVGRWCALGGAELTVWIPPSRTLYTQITWKLNKTRWNS